MALPDPDYSLISDLVFDRRDEHLSLLNAGMESSVNDLDTFQEWVTGRLGANDLTVDEFVMSPEDVSDQPAQQRTIATDPATLRAGPNIVGRRNAAVEGPSTLLFAHADKNPRTYEYAESKPAFEQSDDRCSGPGIADDVSGMTAILSAIELVENSDLSFAGDLLVGSVLGKQLGVLGTYGLVTQFGPTDTAVYVHPAETEAGLNELKVGSNGICEFRITIDGRPPDTNEAMHTVFRESGVNPIEKAATIQQALLAWADDASQRHAYQPLEDLAGRSVSVMIGDCRVDAGESVYTMPTHCTIEGTVCFPPGVDLRDIQSAVTDTIADLYVTDRWLSEATVDFEWGDFVAESAATPADSPFIKHGRTALEQSVGRSPSLYYGHTSSDIRYPVLYWDADTFGFGPRAGDMGEPEEWIDTTEYLHTIATIVALIAETPTT